MKPEQIRIAVAEVMGWTDIRWRPSYVVNQPWLGGINPNPDKIEGIIDAATGVERKPTAADYLAPTNLPDYPSDPAAALTFCDWLAERGWKWVAILEDAGVRFILHKRGELQSHMVIAPTLALAICEAGLKAAGLWKDEEAG